MLMMLNTIKMIFCFILLFLSKLMCSYGQDVCGPANFKIYLPPVVKLFATTSIFLSHDDKECSKDATYHWELHLMTGNEPIVEKVFKINDQRDKSILMDLGEADHDIPFYKYEFKLVATLIPENNNYKRVSVEKIFRVTPEKMELVIDGGIEQNITFGCGDLYIDASKSRDPSFPPSVHPMESNKINWKCTPDNDKTFSYPNNLVLRIKQWAYKDFDFFVCTMTVTREDTPFFPETASVSQFITIKTLPFPPVLKVKCKKNCDPPDAFEEIILEWNCLANCFDDVPASECKRGPMPSWAVKPPNTTITRTMMRTRGRNQVRFLKNAFQPESTVTFQAFLGNGTADLTITFRTKNPKLNLTCKTNCKWFDIALPLTLEVECIENCDDINYEWKTIPSVDFSLNEAKTEITIPEYKLVKDDEIQFNVKALNTNIIANFTAVMTELIPEFSFICTIGNNKTCPQLVDSALSIKIKITCNCTKDFYYTIKPELNEKVKKEKDLIEIPESTYSNGDKFEVTAYQGKHNKTFSLKFKETPPELIITCMNNCGEPANTHMVTKLIGKCLSCKVGAYWQIPGIDQNLIKKWHSLMIDIPPKTFHHDQLVEISFHSGSTNITLHKRYITPQPKLTLNCQINCPNADPFLETILNVTCSAENDVCSDVKFNWEFEPMPIKTKIKYKEDKTILIINEKGYKDGNNVTIKVNGGRSSASMQLSYAEPVPKLSLQCIEHCNPSHPAFKTKLKVVCEENCTHVAYKWNISNIPDTFDWFKSTTLSDGQSIMTINEGTFKGGDKKEITVSSGKSKARLTVNFVELPPQLKITCQPPCNKTLDPLNPVLAWVNCTKYCYKFINFTWDVQNIPKNFDFGKSIITQKNSESIIILPDSFPSGTNVSVVVTSANSIASETLSFVEPTIVLDIICNDNCSSLNTFVPTILTAECKEQCSHATSYFWDLKPPPPDWSLNITSNPFNKSIIIKAETYNEGDDVNVSLYIRNSRVMMKIHFLELISKLTLHCLKSCLEANPFEDIFIEVTCDENCEKVEYFWAIETVKREFNFTKDIILGERNRTFTIIKSAFNDTDFITVSVSNRRASATTNISFSEPIAKINIMCVENCKNGTANPLEKVILNVTCVANCYRNIFTWLLKPPPAKQNWTSDIIYGDQNITINGDAYRDQGSVRIVVSNYKGEAQQDIHFIEPTPETVLTCPDCKKPNPGKDLAFYVHCETCNHYNYTWEISPQPRNFSWLKNVKLGLNNESMIIVQNTFKNNENVSVILTNGKGKSRLDFEYQYPRKHIKITCIENCFPSNPYRKLVLNVTCKYECGAPYYTWKISPLPDNFHWNKNVSLTNSTQIFTLAPDSFLPNQTININVEADSLDDSISIYFKSFDPIIKLECKENCLSNPRRELKIEANCYDFCEHLIFNWEVEPKSIILDSMKQDKNALYIKAKSYKDKETILVTVKAGLSESNISITFHLTDFDGNCVIEPSTGVSGQTEFYIDCQEFKIGSFFRLYQDYSSNQRNNGVLLAFGYNGIKDGFLLSESNNSPLTINIGIGWETKKEMKIPVEVTPFPINQLQNITFGREHGNYRDLLKNKKYFRSVQLASVLSTVLESQNITTQQHDIQHIISGINLISPNLEPMQILSILLKFESKLNGNPLTATLLIEGGQIASKMMLDGKSNPSYTASSLKTFSQDILWLSSNLLSQMPKNAPLLENTIIAPDYPMYADFLLPGADIKRHSQTFTIDLLSTINILIQLVHKSNETRIESDNIIINVKNINKTVFDAQNLTTIGSKSYVQIPQALQSEMHNMKITTFYQYVNFKVNPFWWDDPDNKVNTEIMQLTIDRMEKLSTFIDVYLRKLENPLKEINGETSEPIVLQFTLTETSLFTVYFKKVDSPYFVSIGNCMPGSESFNDKLHIINKNKILSKVTTTSYVYVGINPTKNVKIKYKFKIAAQDCFYWASSELSWRRDLCTISDQQQPDFIHCRCQHLSYFGGRTYIPEMKYTATIKEALPVGKVGKDYTILVAVLTITAIFILLLYLAHRQDLNFYKNNKIHFVEDNVPGDKELYLVLITTGMSQGAGTSANVTIKINGKLGQSRVHVLRSQTNQRFKRNSEDFFAIYAPKCLGELISIKLWHNSRGKQPHWFCERVIIKHPKSHHEYLFDIQRWFSLIYGDCTTKGTFHVSNKGKQKFIWKLRESIRKSHHILSFYTKRPRPGSSKETILVGFASCATVMLASMILLKNTDARDGTTIVIIAFISALSSIPVTVILGWLFENSQ